MSSGHTVVVRPPLRPPRNEREQALFDAVVDELGRNEVPTGGSGILRAGTSLLVGIPGADLLARVDRPALADRATRQVRVAALLESGGAEPRLSGAAARVG